MAEKTCDEKKCSFYLDKFKVHFYRKTFIWTILAASLLVLVVFIFIGWQYNKSQERIVNINEQYCKEVNREMLAMQKDSVELKHQKIIDLMMSHENKLSGLLQLEADKISLGYVILSLWAGILMIVFLVFSIYSMFKTDEMIKQGKADLEKVNKNAEKAESRISSLNTELDEAIRKISEKSTKESETLQEHANDTLHKIEQSSQEFMNQKQKEFMAIYQKYVSELTTAQAASQSMVDSLLKALRDSASQSQESDDSSLN